MYRLTVLLIFVAFVASLGGNLVEYGGAALHPRHGDRLAKAAARDGVLVHGYTAAGRALLPPAGLAEHARSTAMAIYSAAFTALDTQPAATDERALSDMLDVTGVYRPAWRVANVYLTPVLLLMLLTAWFMRPRVIHSFPNQR